MDTQTFCNAVAAPLIMQGFKYVEEHPIPVHTDVVLALFYDDDLPGLTFVRGMAARWYKSSNVQGSSFYEKKLPLKHQLTLESTPSRKVFLVSPQYDSVFGTSFGALPYNVYSAGLWAPVDGPIKLPPVAVAKRIKIDGQMYPIPPDELPL